MTFDPGPARRRRLGGYLISDDGDLVHGVVDGLEQVQHAVQRLLQLRAVLRLVAVFEKLLRARPL